MIARPLALLALLAPLAGAACSDDTSPLAAGSRIEFSINAPDELPVKGVVDVETRILLAQGVEYPLEVTYEKANAGEPFLVVGGLTIASAETSRVSMQVPVFEDPEIRVTVRESSAQGLTVSKSVRVDVLEFP